ncbi:MAG: hypothetical protein HOM11_15750 [Methylococcales bacterium]|jgi:flagellar hook-length control protein FliK|nr:hypothetical protein [Methylococcales bacterium]MBT7442731.1 hypothetical protein [Methylococcales bacterium]
MATNGFSLLGEMNFKADVPVVSVAPQKKPGGASSAGDSKGFAKQLDKADREVKARKPEQNDRVSAQKQTRSEKTDKPQTTEKAEKRQNVAATKDAKSKDASKEVGATETAKKTDVAVVGQAVASEAVASDVAVNPLSDSIELTQAAAETVPVVAPVTVKAAVENESIAIDEAVDADDGEVDDVDQGRYRSNTGAKSESLFAGIGERLQQVREQLGKPSGASDAAIKTDGKLDAPGLVLQGQGKALQQIGQTLGAASARPAVTTYSINKPIGSPEWAPQLGQKITTMVTDKIQQASIRLNPHHLGPVEVKMTTQNEQTSVVFNAQHGLTKEAIEQALPRLKEMLEDAGFDDVHAELSQEAFKDQAEYDADESEQGLSGEGADELNEENDVAQQQAVVQMSTDTAVDYFA